VPLRLAAPMAGTLLAAPSNTVPAVTEKRYPVLEHARHCQWNGRAFKCDSLV
jgi:hypothetical protein